MLSLSKYWIIILKKGSFLRFPNMLMMEMSKIMSRGSRLPLLKLNKAMNPNKMMGQLKLRKNMKRKNKFNFSIQVLSSR